MKYALIVSLFVNVGLVYLLFDSAVSLDGCRINGEHLSARSELALKVLEDSWIGFPVEDILKTAEKYKAEVMLIKRQKDQAHIGDLVFRVDKDDKIKEVYYLSD